MIFFTLEKNGNFEKKIPGRDADLVIVGNVSGTDVSLVVDVAEVDVCGEDSVGVSLVSIVDVSLVGDVPTVDVTTVGDISPVSDVPTVTTVGDVPTVDDTTVVDLPTVEISSFGDVPVVSWTVVLTFIVEGCDDVAVVVAVVTTIKSEEKQTLGIYSD